MAMEADGVAERIEDRDQVADRRVRTERRRRERRRPGGRNNRDAPRPSPVTGGGAIGGAGRAVG